MAYTLHDIAALSGVSIATVSRVINGKPGVNTETREKIIRKIKELDYQVNFNAKSMKTRRTNTIGLITADITNPFYSEAAKTIEFQARKQNYTLIVGNTGNSMSEEQTIIRAFQQRQVDGFIFASSALRDSAVENLVNSPVPVLLYHRHLGGQCRHHFVGSDERKGIALALEHLSSLGHRRVAFISGSRKFSTGAERLRFFLELRRTYGIDETPHLIQEGGYEIAKTSRAVEQLMRLQHTPTAIFAANDFMALQVLHQVLELGYRVPEDISVMGYDDIPLASHNSIQLSTIDVQITHGAHLAVMNLINLIDGIASDTQPVRMLLEPKLVIRSSTAPPT